MRSEERSGTHHLIESGLLIIVTDKFTFAEFFKNARFVFVFRFVNARFVRHFFGEFRVVFFAVKPDRAKEFTLTEHDFIGLDHFHQSHEGHDRDDRQRITAQKIFKEDAAFTVKRIRNKLLAIFNRHVIEFNVMYVFAVARLEHFLVSAEKLPNVRIGERVFFAFRLFHAATVTRSEVLIFHALQFLCHLFVALVFEHLLNEFVAGKIDFRFVLFSPLVLRQKFANLHRHKAARHQQEVPSLRKIRLGNILHPFEVLVGDFRNRNIGGLHFALLHQVQQKIHRAFKCTDVYLVRFWGFVIQIIPPLRSLPSCAADQHHFRGAQQCGKPKVEVAHR